MDSERAQEVQNVLLRGGGQALEIAEGPVSAMIEVCSGLRIGNQHVVGRVLDKPQTEHRRRNAKDHIVVGQLRGKVGLCDATTWSIAASGDGVEVVDAAVQILFALLRVAVGVLEIIGAGGRSRWPRP